MYDVTEMIVALKLFETLWHLSPFLAISRHFSPSPRGLKYFGARSHLCDVKIMSQCHKISKKDKKESFCRVSLVPVLQHADTSYQVAFYTTAIVPGTILNLLHAKVLIGIVPVVVSIIKSCHRLTERHARQRHGLSVLILGESDHASNLQFSAVVCQDPR
jgi:hypothetical protein